MSVASTEPLPITILLSLSIIISSAEILNSSAEIFRTNKNEVKNPKIMEIILFLICMN